MANSQTGSNNENQWRCTVALSALILFSSQRKLGFIVGWATPRSAAHMTLAIADHMFILELPVN
jgi:hypothetical protein